MFTLIHWVFIIICFAIIIYYNFYLHGDFFFDQYVIWKCIFSFSNHWKCINILSWMFNVILPRLWNMNCKIKSVCWHELCPSIFLISHDFSKHTLKECLLFIFGSVSLRDVVNLSIKFSLSWLFSPPPINYYQLLWPLCWNHPLWDSSVSTERVSIPYEISLLPWSLPSLTWE